MSCPLKCGTLSASTEKRKEQEGKDWIWGGDVIIGQSACYVIMRARVQIPRTHGKFGGHGLPIISALGRQGQGVSC